jgi:hypothetical protein
MKQKTTKTETRTSSASNAHDGRIAADTNNTKKYRVVLYYTQTCEAVLYIKANSLALAESLAEEIEPDQLTDDDLNPINRDLVVDSVKLVGGGKTDE